MDFPSWFEAGPAAGAVHPLGRGARPGGEGPKYFPTLRRQARMPKRGRALRGSSRSLGLWGAYPCQEGQAPQEGFEMCQRTSSSAQLELFLVSDITFWAHS